MKRSLLIIAGCGVAGIVLPLVAFAQFRGTSNAPPYGNVPGVVWNTKGTGLTQDAQINITGSANVSNIQTDGTASNIIFSDNYLTPGKAFKINGIGVPSYYFGNWNGGLSGPLKVITNGQISVNAIDGSGVAGYDGRVQADKFCFNPGGVSDCITSWAGGAGSYVAKAGDTMSGALNITVPGGTPIALQAQGGVQGAYLSGSTFGLNAQSPQTAVIALGTNTGGDFTGLTGLRAKSNNPSSMSSVAIVGYNAQLGGQFTGTSRGLDANGYNYGVLATATNTATGIAVSGAQGGTGGDFSGANYGVDARTSSAGSGTAVRGTNGQYGGYFTGSYAGGYNNGGSYGSLNYGGTFGTYNVGGSAGGLFYDGGYSTVTYISQPGIGLETTGIIKTDGAAGIQLGQSDSPMITRGWDPITSGAKAGYGRWGMYMEPSTLTVGIPGTDAGTKYFSVVKYDTAGNRTNLFYTDNSGNFVIPTGTASKPGGGSWTVYSDARLKDIHGNFTRGLDAIDALQPISYNYAKDNAEGLPTDKTYIGVTAQNVQSVIPEAVTKDAQGYLQLNNDPVIWTMVNSIKELKAENEALKARLDKLEQK